MTARRIASPCTQAGCPRVAVKAGRCAEHQRKDVRPSAASRGYGAIWRKVRAAFLKNNPSCEGCGAPATDVDHRVPLAAGGTNDEENLTAMCHRCHSVKTATHDGGFGRRGG